MAASSNIPIEQFLNKALYARILVNVYRDDNQKGGYKIVYQAKAGELIGKPYSWIGPNERTGQKIFLMYDDYYKKPYYTRFDPALYNLQALKDQGAKTEKEVEQEGPGKGNELLDRGEKLIKLGLWLGAAALAAKFIVPAIIDRNK